MKYLVSLVCLILMTAAPVLAQRPASKSPSEIAKEQSPAVVVIEQLDSQGNVVGQGSGFIVTSQGAVITNLHVIQGAISLRVKLPNGDVYKTADVVDFDEAKDIAIIKVKGFQLPVVKLGDSDRTEVGDAIVAISSPEGLTNSLSTGVVSGVRRFETHRVFQITAPISQGSSGGALFDSSGAVIGITTFVFKAGQNINFAVPINYARGMIGDQVTTTLAKLPIAPLSSQSGVPAPASGEAASSPEIILDNRMSSAAARQRLGLTPQEPMFARPDQALAFFYRLVEGIGLSSLREVADLTRTAVAIKTKESATSEEYTIKYLSFYSGLTLGFSKPERVLQSVELLVNWSLEDLERTFGKKHTKRKGPDGQSYLEIKGQDEGKQVIATLDSKGNVSSVRFSKAK
jgi:S1-C subfamily serine protease